MINAGVIIDSLIAGFSRKSFNGSSVGRPTLDPQVPSMSPSRAFHGRVQGTERKAVNMALMRICSSGKNLQGVKAPLQGQQANGMDKTMQFWVVKCGEWFMYVHVHGLNIFKWFSLTSEYFRCSRDTGGLG